MKDEELLRLAEKAIGQEPSDENEMWNPLEDDGDALRLVVKLGLTLEFARYYAVCYSGSRMAAQFTEQATMGYSIEEATRRAIVKAAAEIGKRSK